MKAGNDILLLPSDLDAAYRGVLKAVRSGEITEARIDQSVLKILRAKARSDSTRPNSSISTPSTRWSPSLAAC